jgi:NADPH-ferrihemoprotein reductase
MPIQISAVDSTGRVPIPTPTTHDAAVPYYVEISGPVSRQSLNTIAEFAGDEDQNEAPLKLGKDKVYFIMLWAVSCLTWHNSSRRLAQVNLPVPLPFAALLECVRTLQPRYYCISSLSLIQKETVSMTVAVESVHFPGRYFKGISSNYLLVLKPQHNGEDPAAHGSTYAISGPPDKYKLGLAIHIRLRHSTFRLPADASRPVVMVGPGTGGCPFSCIHSGEGRTSAGWHLSWNDNPLLWLSQGIGRLHLFVGKRPS